MRILMFLFFLGCFASPEVAHADLSFNDYLNVAASSQTNISKQQAASLAKSAYPGNKILSVKLIGGSGPPVYRVKMLSTSGVVKYVFVDANSGSVFE